MPSQPGIYVEEVAGAAHPIAGVATSIAAFVGRAARGPSDGDPASPVMLAGFADFQRAFGAPEPAFPMAYAVRDFFANGGRQALVVRLYRPAPGEASRARIAVPGLPLVAASAGAWGNGLRARVERADASGTFDLRVHDAATGREETFAGVTMRDGPRGVAAVLAAESALARVDEALLLPSREPPAVHARVEAGEDPWARDDASTGVAAEDEAGDGLPLEDADYLGDAGARTGLHALRRADLFNLLCVPPDARGGDTAPAVHHAALALCVERRAMLVVDPPAAWRDAAAIARDSHRFPASLGIDGVAARNAVIYFPRLHEPDPSRAGEVGTFAPCGAAAGVMARTDHALGVWRAPAGIDATLECVPGLDVVLSDHDNELLNPLGINCLRDLPSAGPVVWGARTLRGADAQGDEYKYLPVRRLALHIEESLLRGTAWAATEPNGERLWARLRLDVGDFMHALFLKRAFLGATPAQAYFVRCDAGTTSQADVAMGLVHVQVGFAPLRPAEFVVIDIARAAARASD
jgi:phage tail sheath protein FI